MERNMRIDLLEPPDCLYYEDKNLKRIDWDITQGLPDDPKAKYQIYKGLEVRESIVRVGGCQRAKWPVRFLEWLAERMPQRWKAIKSGEIYVGGSTVNCMYPVIKYLVEKRGWGLNDAAVLCGEICGRCMNLLLQETDPNFTFASMPSDYFKKARGTWCKHCKIIDPDYDKRHRVWCVCRTWKMGGDVELAYKNTSCYSHPDYWKTVK
jgi:hypothetical protein